MEVIEYAVRPVTRYVVTKYQVFTSGDGRPGSALSHQIGEFDSLKSAELVTQALVDADRANGLPSERYLPPEK